MKPSLRFRVFERDHFTCQYCGRTSKDTELHVDHIFPKSKGGADVMDNLRTACRDCNLGKGARVLEIRWALNPSLYGKGPYDGAALTSSGDDDIPALWLYRLANGDVGSIRGKQSVKALMEAPYCVWLMDGPGWRIDPDTWNRWRMQCDDCIEPPLIGLYLATNDAAATNGNLFWIPAEHVVDWVAGVGPAVLPNTALFGDDEDAGVDE